MIKKNFMGKDPLNYNMQKEKTLICKKSIIAFHKTWYKIKPQIKWYKGQTNQILINLL